MLISISILLLIIIKLSLSTTSIKTFPTIELKENVKMNTHVINLKMDKKNELKLLLLNLGGFETNLFEIRNESIYTINEIDREKLFGEKKCFDRLYCLIEIHILVNDGEQYWVIPIHIIDENDNKPEFKNSQIELRFDENILGGYKIPFEGAKDLDEGLNGKIYYKLNSSTLLFKLLILSESSILNQYDQLALKFLPSLINSNEFIKNEYQLILYAFNLINQEEKLINSMIINIKINKILKKPIFDLNEYKFIIKLNSSLKNNFKIGKINAKSNDLTKQLIYNIINKTDLIEINSLTGDLVLLNQQNLTYLNEINLLIQSSYLINQNLKSFVNCKLLFRDINLIKNISFNINNSININQNDLINSNDILFNLSILSYYYPNDKYFILLENNYSIFSFSSFSLKLINHNLILNNNYLLTFKIKHQLTNEYLPNLNIQLNFIENNQFICFQNLIYILKYLNNNNQNIIKLKVIQTNENISNFSNHSFKIINHNKFIVNNCEMSFNENIYLNETLLYELCLLNNSLCYNVSYYNNNNINLIKRKLFNLKTYFSIRSIELIIFILFSIFILITTFFIFIICRLKGFHLCLTIKNYLFYGKKYGLNNAQRLSSQKFSQRIHSIVVRESRSPSIERNKPNPYVFNINQYVEQEINPSIDIYSHSSTSFQRDEGILSNIDNDIRNKMPTTSSSLFTQETKQLLDIISPNQDFDVSKLASEV